MAIDQEFEQLGREHVKARTRAADEEAASEARRRADEWAALTKFVPYSSMQSEGGETDAKPHA